MKELDTLDVCEDCKNYIEAEFDALAHHYSEKEYEEVKLRCKDAVIAYSDLLIDSYSTMGKKLKAIYYIYDQDGEIDFTWKGCELCFNSRGGKRHRYNIMGVQSESN